MHWSTAAAFTTALGPGVAKAYGTSKVLAQSAGTMQVGSLLLDAAQQGVAVHPTPAATSNTSWSPT